jgi:hypothetical protein
VEAWWGLVLLLVFEGVFDWLLLTG